MYNLDSLSLKYFFEENKNFINGSIVQKIQLPSRYEVILTIRNLNLKDSKPENKKLYININPKYPHICFLDEKTYEMRNITIPPKPPMFCMQLRKYLNGSKIKDFRIIKYERILELYFDYFDEIGSLTKLCLTLELMGKHSNIILYNAMTKIIIGSIHNISQEKSSIREIYGGINYTYPPLKEKLDLLNVSYSTFNSIAKSKNINEISDNFYYFSQSILKKALEKYKNINELFSFLQSLQIGKEKEFIVSFWNENNSLNLNIDKAINYYFSNLMFEDILKLEKFKLRNHLKNEYKKLTKVIDNIPNKENLEKLKYSADMIMSNLDKINYGQREFCIDGFKIKLDENISSIKNAQKYYDKYKKEKTTFKYSSERYRLAKEKLEYYETILFNIDNSENFVEIQEIYEELIKIGIINNTIKQKVQSIIQKISYLGYEIYIGKNNKQNDFLISKIANNEDLWFHGLNFPSSHVILKVPNNKKQPTKEVLEYCARLTKEHSKAKDGGKASIIMTKRKNLKKPPNTYLGYVTYKDETEIII